MYFTAETHFVERFERMGRSMGMPTDLKLEDLAGWQARLREKLAGLLGLNSFEKTSSNPSYDPPETFDGYQSQRIEIDTEPGVRMPFYILTPADLEPGELRPVVLALHGHGGGGKAAVAGRRENPIIAERIDLYNYDFGVQMVKAGYIAVCPDARGFGERRERFAQGDDPDLVLGQSCNYLSHMGEPLGQTVAGMMAWDLMRLLDFIITRPDSSCDPDRIGCVGFSGGGLQALWLTIFDERVKVAAISGYFYGYKDALLRLSNNCSCNYVPGLWQTADMGDLGALIYPRPLLIESGTLDPLNGERGIINVTEQLAITRQAYALTGDSEKVYHSVYEGPHQYNGKDVIPWFKRWL